MNLKIDAYSSSNQSYMIWASLVAEDTRHRRFRISRAGLEEKNPEQRVQEPHRNEYNFIGQNLDLQV